MSKPMCKFKYLVSGLKGSVVYCDFQDSIEITIEAEKISQASDNLKQYFADNFLTCDKIVLKEISF